MKKEKGIFENISNIDVLDIGNACNQNCKQCFYNTKTNSQNNIFDTLSLLDKIKKNNTFKTSPDYFLFPKEISTSPELIDVISDNKQNYVLTNGKDLIKNRSILDKLKDHNINRIKFTLFPNKEEQLFWNGNNSVEYDAIKNGIKLSINQGFLAEVFSMITPQNYMYIKNFYRELSDMGVSRLNLLNFIPTGNGGNLELKYLMNKNCLNDLVGITDGLKNGLGPYISYGLGFGPNFYGNSVYKYLNNDYNHEWLKSKFLCPVVDNSYFGISIQNKEIYWCYKLLTDKNAKIGEVNSDGEIYLSNKIDFSKNTLINKLRGICSKDNCDFQEKCLGGCRSQAYTVSKIKGERDPEYAGQDVCLTNLLKERSI